MKYIPRNITPEILDALSTSPVVLLNGARQTGKSTLAQHLGRQRGFRYVSLDDLTVLEGISHDPSGYIMSLPLPVIIDEVQREPRLFRVIKMLVDRRRQPGQFFLTGSANVLMLPRMAEFLAGRMEILTLWPFSCDELMGRKSVFIDQVFSEHFPYFHEEDLLLPDLVRKLIQGGYPEILKLSSPRRRNAWFDAYITTILQRDVRDLARIEGLHELPRLLSLIAANAGAMLNLSDLSRRTGLVTMTLKRYLTLLEATFLVQRIPAWSGNIGKRLIKAPRIYLNDTGLLCYLLGCDEERLFKEPQMRGQVLENYVVQELHKQRVWSEARPGIFYFRTTTGQEVDIVLEKRDGSLVGIEVKASATVTRQDTKGLQELARLTGDRFVRGILLYTGEHTVPFGPQILAVPVTAMWKLSQPQDSGDTVE